MRYTMNHRFSVTMILFLIAVMLHLKPASTLHQENFTVVGYGPDKPITPSK